MSDRPIAPAREPLLSDERLRTMWALGFSATGIRDWYEAKITSGELRVVKKTGRTLAGFRDREDETFYYTDCCKKVVDEEALHCPQCGNEILPL